MGAGEEEGPFENENWVPNVWKFQLLPVAHRPLDFGRYRRGVGIDSGGLPQGVIELLGACEKRARLRTRTGLLTPGDFSYYMGPVSQWVSGVTGGVWAFIRAGLPQ